jgi:SpoVK/Ycf46/Vps4 family AAA+-type ATPase
MDGLRENRGVLTILTSNAPEKMPNALIDRPGRFHDILNFDVPKKEMRKEMILKWSKEEIDEKSLEAILEQTEGLSGAHIKELVEFAKMIQEDEEVNFSEALLKSLEKIKKQRELIHGFQKEIKSMEDLLEVKEGRVLSGKNKKAIKEAVIVMKDAVAALEKLLEATEGSSQGTPENAEGGNKEIKVEKPREAQVSQNEIVVRALQKIARETNFALNKAKKQK